LLLLFLYRLSPETFGYTSYGAVRHVKHNIKY